MYWEFAELQLVNAVCFNIGVNSSYLNAVNFKIFQVGPQNLGFKLAQSRQFGVFFVVFDYLVVRLCFFISSY